MPWRVKSGDHERRCVSPRSDSADGLESPGPRTEGHQQQPQKPAAATPHRAKGNNERPLPSAFIEPVPAVTPPAGHCSLSTALQTFSHPDCTVGPGVAPDPGAPIAVTNDGRPARLAGFAPAAIHCS